MSQDASNPDKKPSPNSNSEKDPYFIEMPNEGADTPPASLTESETSLESNSTEAYTLKPLRFRHLKTSLIALSALLAIIVFWEGFSTVYSFYQWHWIAGAVSGFGLLLAILFILRAVLEARAHRLEIHTIESLQDQAEQLQKERTFGKAGRYIKGLEKLYTNKPQAKLLKHCIENKTDYHDDKELIQDLELRFLSTLDQEALKRIVKYSKQTALMVSLSPLAIVDMALALWRSSKMMDEIAQVYGIRPSWFGRFKLYQVVWQQIAFAGAGEVISDYLVELSSNKLVASLSGKFAQGLGAGLYNARIGLKAMNQCRPIAFSKETQPKLTHVLKEMNDYVEAQHEKVSQA